jgi:hypothetical protein
VLPGCLFDTDLPSKKNGIPKDSGENGRSVASEGGSNKCHEQQTPRHRLSYLRPLLFPLLYVLVAFAFLSTWYESLVAVVLPFADSLQR